MSDKLVSDHAVLRYLERVYGVDVARLKRRIERATEDARRQGAAAVNTDGARFVLSKSGRVVTVTGFGTSMTNRGKRWRKRYK